MRTDADRLREAIVEIRRLRAQVEALSETHDRAAPVALIGAACRIHGGPDSPEAFWEVLQSGRDCITETPQERWDLAAWYSPDPDVPGKVNTRYGGYLTGLSQFDPGFFGISDREARQMDPQQRLLLEVSWEALEGAAQAPARLFDSPTGVFFALNNNEYFQMAMEADPSRLDAYSISGGVHSTAAGRLSYLLGLRGPSLSVDTACSSSLAAAHLAIQSLRARECQMAVVGGVHLTLRPHLTVGLSRLKMIAPDGRCKAFDAAADGFVQGEGCVVVVLKLLAQAIKDRDPILAVIRGSAMNQDGRSSGLTAPSGPAQEEVIRAALSQSGLLAREVSFVETHGTGTALGDPLEARALSAAYCRSQDRQTPLLLGALKTNVGHLGPASGLAGLIKLAWCLREAEIPPNLHLQRPSPYVEWDREQVALPTAKVPWPADSALRAGGVSSFGFSGTNVHMVVQEFREAAAVSPHLEQRLLPISARDSEALRVMVEKFSAYLQQTSDSWAAICHTAGWGRDHATHRLAVVAGSAFDAASTLRSYLAGTIALPNGVVVPHPTPKLGWILRESASLEGVLASIDAWRGVGIQPDIVAGDGRFGALAAAYASGAITAEEALSLLNGANLSNGSGPLRARWLNQLDRHQLTRWYQGEGFAGEKVSGCDCTLVIDAGTTPNAERLAELYTAGFAPDWRAVDSSGGARCVRLPTSPFQRRHLWAFDNGPLRGDSRMLSQASPSYMQGHLIAGDVVVPGAWFVAWGLELAGSRRAVRNVTFHRRLTLPASRNTKVEIRLSPAGDWGFFSAADSLLIASCETAQAQEPPQLSDFTLNEAVRIGSRKTHLRAAAERAVQLGPEFQAIEAIYELHGETIARLVIPDSLSGSEPSFPWHPALLDACLQTCGQFIQPRETWIPAAIDEVAMWASAPREFWCRAVCRTKEDQVVRADLECFDDAGRPLLSIQGALFRPMQPTAEIRDWFYATDWERLHQPRRLPTPVRVAVLNPAPQRTAASLEAALRDQGAIVTADEPDVIVLLDVLDFLPWESALKELRRVLREVVDLPLEQQPALWFVTRRATSASAEQAAWWGLASTLGPENKGPRVRRFDLDEDDEGIDGLASCICSDVTEDEVRWRDGDLWSPRLRRHSVDGEAWEPRPDGLYLITGGTGGIGFAVAEELIANGARHLVLAARKSPSPALTERIYALAKDARIEFVAADVADEQDVRRLLAFCNQQSVPLRGIFHTAGVVSDGLFLQLDDAQWKSVTGPKWRGAEYLDRFSRDLDLDCFVLFSSISAYMGAAGQANYAAANAALDTIALARHAANKPALSINWGPWSEVGMAAAMGEFGERRLEQLGFQAMTPRQGCLALWKAMNSGLTQVTVLPPVRWERLISKLHLQGAPSRLHDLAAKAPIAHNGNGNDRSPAADVMQEVQKIAAGILGVATMPEVDRPLLASGFDSLMAMEMRAALIKSMGVNLPVSSFLSGLTLRDLASQCVARDERELFAI
jgi:acyl transferase domain-containing protein/acyl carrier protein